MSADVDSSTSASSIRRTAELAKAAKASKADDVDKPAPAKKAPPPEKDRMEAAPAHAQPPRAASEPAMPKGVDDVGAAAKKNALYKPDVKDVKADATPAAAPVAPTDAKADVKDAKDDVKEVKDAKDVKDVAPVAPVAPPETPKETPQTDAEKRSAMDDRMKAAGVDDVRRKSVMKELEKVQGKELDKELGMVDHALKSPNASRALAAYDKLAKMAGESPKAKERLTPEVRESLVKGVADSRTDKDIGKKGILGTDAAEKAARAIIDMPQAQHDELKASLDKAGKDKDGKPVAGADADAERSTLLKAVAARSDKLADPAKAADAMKEVTGFADKIRGMERKELIKATTPLGVDERSGVGLAQRWEDSCGPTTAQWTQAERDPIYANKLRTDPEFAKAEQKATLEKPRFYDKHDKEVKVTPEQEAKYLKDGTKPPGVASVWSGKAMSRERFAAEDKLGKQLWDDKGKAKAPLSEKEAGLVERHAKNERLSAKEEKEAKAAIEKLRARDGGSPTDADLKASKDNYKRNRDGTSTPTRGEGMALENALNDLAPPKKWEPSDTKRGGGASDADLKKVDDKLEKGVDVPIRIDSASGRDGHFLMIGDKRGEGDKKEYLVSDPWTGKTAWVPAKEMKDPKSNWFGKRFEPGGRPTFLTTTYAEK